MHCDASNICLGIFRIEIALACNRLGNTQSIKCGMKHESGSLIGGLVHLIFCVLMGGTSTVVAEVETEILLRSGDVLPSRTGALIFTIETLRAVDVAGDGTIVFFAEAKDSLGFPLTGIWKRLPNGQVEAVATDGDDVLDFGLSDVVTGVDDSLVSVSENGRVGFLAGLQGAPQTPFALFLTEAGTPVGSFVAGQAFEISGSGTDAEIDQFFSFATTPGGGIVFSGSTISPSDSTPRGNVWISPGGIGAETALFPPSSGSESRFKWTTDVQVGSVLGDGTIDIFGRGTLENPVLPAPSPESTWIVTNSVGESRVEIFGPEPAPGIPGNQVAAISDVATNSSRVSAVAVTTDDGASTETDAIYVGPSGNGVPVLNLFSVTVHGFLNTSGPPQIRKGDVAPGTDGLAFETLDLVKIAEDGRIAVQGRVFDPSQQGSAQEPTGIWIEGSSGLELILLEGRPFQVGQLTFLPATDINFDNAAFDSQGRLVASVGIGDASNTHLLLRSQVVLPSPDVVPSRRPVVRVKGRLRRTVRRSPIILRGRVIADVAIARVEFRSQVQRRFRKARGKARWQARVRLISGRNVVRIRAIDSDGNRSRVVRLIIRRR